eukprot:scaffold62238_cov63-Phaeocystis_antarctica.AAC.1
MPSSKRRTVPHASRIAVSEVRARLPCSPAAVGAASPGSGLSLTRAEAGAGRVRGARGELRLGRDGDGIGGQVDKERARLG